MMTTLNMDRRFLYHQDLTLPERIMLCLVKEAGDEGFMYGTRYLARAMNVTIHRVDVIKNILLRNGYITDSADGSPPGVMRLSVLFLGPAANAILASRKIDSGDTNSEYIPCANLEEIIEAIKVER